MRSPFEISRNDVPRMSLASAAALALFSLMVIAPGRGGSVHAQPVSAKSSDAKAPLLHGEKLAEAVCATCHGPHGNKTVDPKYPKIAGQKYTYLLQQLQAFKSGARKSDVMPTVLADISNAQLPGLARWYSQQAVEANTVKDRRLANIGARVFNSPGRGTPPCAACHSARGYGPMMGRGGMMGRGMMGHMGMMGNTANVPRLFGQNADYTVQQLDDFASGKRRGTVMGAIAARLPKQYRRAVAAYLSGVK